MESDFLKLKQDLTKKVEKLRSMSILPFVHINDHFQSIRADIDSTTETLLSQLEESGDKEKMVSKLNSLRDEMITELSKQESELLSLADEPGSEAARTKTIENCDLIENQIEAIFTEERDDTISMNDLEDEYERLALQVIDQTKRLECVLMSNRSFIFVKSERGMVKPGVLVIFLTDHLDPVEEQVFR